MFQFFEENHKEHPEFFWFIIIMIGLFTLWVITGGPERSQTEQNNKFLEPPAPLGSGKTYDEPVFKENGPLFQNPTLR